MTNYNSETMLDCSDSIIFGKLAYCNKLIESINIITFELDSINNICQFCNDGSCLKYRNEF